jgi:hypothetical protein
MRARPLSIVVVVALTGACSSTTTSPDTGPIAQADFPAAVAKAYCPTVASCCPSSNAACEANIRAWASSVFTAPEFAKQKYDPAKARACVDAIAALPSTSCATDLASRTPALAVCARVVNGVVAAGGVCDVPSDCERPGDGSPSSGFAGCSELDGAPPKRCRQFLPTSKLGAACQEEPFAGQAPTVNVCTDDLFCSAGKCVTAPKLGEPCGACGKDLFCAAGTCVAAGKEGEPCTNGCVSGLVCNGTTCTKLPNTPWILSIGLASSSYECK